MKHAKINEFYRLKAEELLFRWKQIKSLSPNHNLSIGLFAENILRHFLREVLPKKAVVTQGIISHNGRLSNQCDIIIYNGLEYAPIYTFSDFDIVPSESVYCVIEVKSSISRKTFTKTLSDFEKLTQLNVHRKYLFIFNSCQLSTFEQYFHIIRNPVYRGLPQDVSYIVNGPSYDHDSFGDLPDAIISLNQKFFLQKAFCSEDTMGYHAYIAKDDTNQEIIGLQTFVEEITRITSPHIGRNIPCLKNSEDINEDNLSSLVLSKEISLFRM